MNEMSNMKSHHMKSSITQDGEFITWDYTRLKLEDAISRLHRLRIKPTTYKRDDGLVYWYDNETYPVFITSLISKIEYLRDTDPYGGLRFLKRICWSSNRWFQHNNRCYDVNKGVSVYYENYESRPNNMLEIPKREQTLICEICADLIN